MRLPDFEFEKVCPQESLVIGVDEVGRGALAGPIVAGAVCLVGEISWLRFGIDDSKRLTPEKREKLAKIIKKNAVCGIGEVGVAYINRYGIVKSTEKAMRKAVAQVRSKSSMQSCFILVDAFHVKYIPGVGLKNQKAIVKGDQKSISIAAASIIAKVYRDQLMAQLPDPIYRWNENKGYGTKAHMEAIRKYGTSRQHRVDFCRQFVLNS